MTKTKTLKAQFRNDKGDIVKLDDSLTDLLTYKEAKEYCRILGLGWRLPKYKELDTLYAKREVVLLTRELDAGVPYWSDREKDMNYAYCVRMNSECSRTMQRPVPNSTKLRVVFVYGGKYKND
tara:strand:- start:618 stop:986 length:369 start_codon:yes stop_codon:yes gene_type:complete